MHQKYRQGKLSALAGSTFMFLDSKEKKIKSFFWCELWSNGKDKKQESLREMSTTIF